jgi:hypothetical protein
MISLFAVNRGERRVSNPLHSAKIQIAAAAANVASQMNIFERRSEDSVDIRLLKA